MLSLTPTAIPNPDDAIAAQVAAFEADLRRRNDPAVLAENAAAREWQILRGRIGADTGLPPLCFRDGRDLMRRFDAAEASGDMDTARDLARMAHNLVHPSDPQPIVESEALRARRAAAAEEAAKVQAEARQRYAEEERQAFLRRFPDSSFVLREVEKRGALRLGADGAVLYSGSALDDELLRGLTLYERDVRVTLNQKVWDRVVLPAPEPSGPARQAA